jgi:hypothetical protein
MGFSALRRAWSARSVVASGVLLATVMTGCGTTGESANDAGLGDGAAPAPGDDGGGASSGGGAASGDAQAAAITWPGVTCADDSGPTQAYFRVPRGAGDGDFYRLPFPNDVRNHQGKLDLSGHPTPGPGALGYDVVQSYLDDLAATADGFSANPTVLFRFSAAIDQKGSLKGPNAIQWLDVTQPSAPVAVGFQWSSSSLRNAYLCDDWVASRPPVGLPLTAGHTYAVLLSSSILDASLRPIEVAPDLTALLATTAPADPQLAAAWPSYKPLRDWAQGAGVATSTILDATVFTVGHPATTASKLVTAVGAAAAPAATGWIRCGDAPSPCPQATGDRACGAPDPAFDELHALVTLPIFQRGTEPYVTPSDGGDLALGADGTPVVQRTESVCLALTVPRAVPMPAGGWPLVLYAHGTGGSFRSAVTDGVAAREAAIDDGMGGTLHAAVLGIDQVDHGTRRGSSTSAPATLFYDFANPKAARGNALQAAADQVALLRFAQTLALSSGQSPTSAAIKVGPIAFWGQGQGANAGAAAMPYVTGVEGAVLSGVGASVVETLLGKEAPLDVADTIAGLVQDSAVGPYHPMLALMQNDLEPADPLVHAATLVIAPVSVATTKNVFQPFGVGDTYAPESAAREFAAAAELAEVSPPAGMSAAPLAGAPFPAPFGQNATKLGVIRTAAVRQYQPVASSDGDLVVYASAAAEADVDHFLGDCLAGQAPNVGR